jgi:galactose oxidase
LEKIMGVLLQGFYKLLPNNAVPSPADGKPGVPWWWDHLAAQAKALSLAGFTAVWLPPVLKSASGAGPGADGYGPYDDYDIGSKPQKSVIENKSAIETRFGKREDLQRCAAILRANGLDIYLDMVEHHRAGDGGKPPDAFVFRYLGANGTPGIGRFPKNPGNFLPQAPRDPHLGGAPKDDLPFGRELAPINGTPAHYVSDNLIDACDWLTRSLDAQGYRLDDVKGLSTDFLLPFLNSKSMAGKFAVGEFFDGNSRLVNQWIFNPQGMQGRPSAFDFPLKFLITSMCNNPGRFDMADLDHAGLTGISPQNSVTFVENHDTDLQNSQKIVSNKLLGYAYILTSEGYPAVFYKDYSTDPGCYGLQPQIDNLIWIHEVLADGPTQQRWKDFDVFAYERTGGPGLLVALNNNPGATHTINVATGFGGNVHLKDYTGHGGDVFTDGGGNITLNVPPNVNGLGYVCYSRVGQDRALAPASHATVQDIEGALDLDILPAINGKTVTAGRVWCAAGTSLNATVAIDRTDWDASAKVDVTLTAPDATRTTLSVGSASAAAPVLDAKIRQEGFHSFEIAASGLPAANSTPAYKLSVTYSAPQTFVATNPAASPEVAGQWSPVFELANVAIHAHLLPTGKVLYWGRRAIPGAPTFASLNEHFCSTFLWDPATGKSQPTAQPPRLDTGQGVNLFCSGHSFMPDGRLLVVGGHLFDSEGVNQACIYDAATDTWTALPRMNNGRWYPSALALPDGGVLAISGSFAQGRPQPPPDNAVPPPQGTQFPTNPNPEIWRDNAWAPTVNFIGLQLFPRLHVEPKQGRVFMSGPQGETFFLDVTGPGTWTPGPVRDGALRDYAPSVMYDSGKVMFCGGGLDPNTLLPTNGAEIIDLGDPNPQWKQTNPMNFPRRQHNATVLADGTVLVTGGTQGVAGNPAWLAFDNVRAGGPVRQSELWDPATEKWTLMADESVDRCYHSTALLLPDGRVISGGGGEYAPGNPALPGQPNPPGDTHKNAQLFTPPYLLKGGARPAIATAPTEITYAKSFDITVGAKDKIAKVSWVRLGSVTHSCNQNQMLIFLTFQQVATKVTIQPPQNANVAPPGHYLLFVLDTEGVPSVAHIARISAQPVAQVHNEAFALMKPAAAPVTVDLAVLDKKIADEQGKPPIVVGVTPSCPYGIGACWGGAFDALQQLSGIKVVRPLPDSTNSLAFVYLQQDSLPDLDDWREEFAEVANGSYVMRGIEVTVTGTVTDHLAKLTLAGTATRPDLVLAPLQASDKIQWDITTRANMPMTADEESAFARLSSALAKEPAGATVQVIGPLKKDGAAFFLEVREFEVEAV